MKNDQGQNLLWLLKDKYGQNPDNPRLSRQQWREFLKDAARLKKGELIDYVIGWKPFLNCKIDLRYRPLIPRSETEYWTEQAITKIKNYAASAVEASLAHSGRESGIKKIVRVLDIFAGSGCVGIAVLKNVKNAGVDFGEIDKRLIQQIKLNLKINKVLPYRYRVFHSNVLKNIGMTNYDFILANPPYIATSDMKQVARSVLKYEPKRALFGGRDGLDIVKEFLKDAPRCLKPHGQIWMEFNPRQKNSIRALAKKLGYGKIEFQKDQYNRWRYVILRLRL